MTKRISQANTVAVPVAQTNGTDGKVVAAKAVVVPADADVTAVKAEVKADEAPEVVVAVAAPAPMAMVAQDTTTSTTTTATTDSTMATTDDAETDKTPYIVGGALLAGGILAIALSSGDDNNSAPAPTPTPPPAPTPTNAVTISSATTATVAENVAAGSAGVVVLDVNATAQGAAPTYALSGTDAALFAINSTTGEIRFVNSPNFEATPTKTSYSVVVTASSAANGAIPAATATQNVTITLTNVNEAPTFTSATATATVVENTAAGVVFTAAATDPDAAGSTGGTVAYSLGGTDAAAFTINSTTGAVSLRAPSDFETKPSYTFTVTATDNGASPLSATQTVTLNVTDVAEGVRIDGTGISATSNANYNAATGNVTFIESGAVGNISTINGFTSGDIIQTDTATSNYSFSSQGSTLVISYNNNGVSSQISLPNAAGNNFIFNEASAESAVGFDFFRSSAPPPAASTGTLSGTTTYNAANAAVTYTDDATAPNVSTITNFGSDDRIVVTGTPGTSDATRYSFGSNGQDLTISFNNNGASSQIVLVGAANPNVFVFDEASAERAVGFDFFRYG